MLDNFLVAGGKMGELEFSVSGIESLKAHHTGTDSGNLSER
jgi:hypothetical protein